jgi:GNAT superfamily N-acetyltransferase
MMAGMGSSEEPAPLRSDEERHEMEHLRDELGALDADIERARRGIEISTSAHYEDFILRPLPEAEDLAGGETVRLRDGRAVVIRPVEPADASLLKEGFEHVSAVSRYRRFLFDRPDLTGEEAVDLTRLDRDHQALGAIDPDRRVGVGLARYVRDRSDPKRATAAVTVVDSWQGRGVGSALMERLAKRALDAGIEQFEGHMIVDDIQAQRTFEHAGTVETSRRSRGVLDLVVRLGG